MTHIRPGHQPSAGKEMKIVDDLVFFPLHRVRSAESDNDSIMVNERKTEWTYST